MSITVGNIYKFTFDSLYSSLDGIYKVTNSMDYDTLLQMDVSLLDTWFVPAGLTDTELQAALPNIMSDTFYRLATPDEKVELYVPYQYIVGIPVPDVFEYSKITLAVDLGPWTDPDILATMKTTISEYLENLYGITDTPETMIYDTVWMAEGDYQAIEAARQAVIDGGTGVINYFTETQKKQEIINQQAAQIAALEDLVAQLDAQLNP